MGSQHARAALARRLQYTDLDADGMDRVYTRRTPAAVSVTFKYKVNDPTVSSVLQ